MREISGFGAAAGSKSGELHRVFYEGTKKSEKKSVFDLQNRKKAIYYKHTNEMLRV